MEEKDAVAFHSPESLRVSVELPHVGHITGLGIPRGVTLIVGGGYHGKSTLLHAIETGIYNHIPGDGRELCAADPGAVKVRAYSGRSVASGVPQPGTFTVCPYRFHRSLQRVQEEKHLYNGNKPDPLWAYDHRSN